MTGAAFQVEGLDEARRGFREVAGSTRELAAANRQVAKVVEPRARSYAGSGTRQQARAVAAITGKGTAAQAVISIRNTGAVPFGIGAFLGAVRFRQFPGWVGPSWDIAAGEGPYRVAPAIRDALPEVAREFATAVADTFAPAGLAVG